MSEEDVKQFMKQHIDNYRSAIIDIIHNNTSVLVDEDITSLLKTPPLDSMDTLKTKLLSFAKSNKIVFNTESLNKILESYRKDIIKCCPKIKKTREEPLKEIVSKTVFNKKNTIIHINKKDFIIINRDIRRLVKAQLKDSYENKILNKIDSIFSKDIDIKVKDNIIEDLDKYIKKVYNKQLLENMDIKILVKDTTLMNNVKEQSERYLFTLKNSRLLNETK